MGRAGAEIKKIKGKWAQMGDEVPHMVCRFLNVFGFKAGALGWVLTGFCARWHGVERDDSWRNPEGFGAGIFVQFLWLMTLVCGLFADSLLGHAAVKARDGSGGQSVDFWG